jgi:hypothetical protein
MDYACFALPILTGKTGVARAFLTELEGARKGQYAASERHLGITKEVWAVQQTALGDLLVAYIESAALGEAFARFAASQDEFDRWFKERVLETTGADLNTPPPGPLSDVLSVYAA